MLDALKGFLPAFFASKSADSSSLGAACGVAAVVGHCFPVWLRFRGGKGVATGLGVTLALAPLAALCGAVVWALAWAIARISSVGSLAGAAAALLVAGATANRQVLVAVAAIVCIVAVRHRVGLNSRRMRGTPCAQPFNEPAREHVLARQRDVVAQTESATSIHSQPFWRTTLVKRRSYSATGRTSTVPPVGQRFAMAIASSSLSTWTIA